MQSEYENLTTTRTNKVETALRRIEQLRTRSSVPIAEVADTNGDEAALPEIEDREPERQP